MNVIQKNYKPPKNLMAKRMRLMIIVLLIVFGSIFLFDIARNLFLKRFFAKFALPTLTISSAKAVKENWTPSIPAIGTLIANNGVNVSPQVSGQVIAIHFQSGQTVNAGQPLIQLDARSDQQDLLNQEAQMKLSQLNYQRQANLLKTNATSQASFDQASAQLQQNQAGVAKTQILIDQKLIKAPFAGRLGIRNVNIGQYVSTGTGLVNLQSIDPLLLQFSLPEQNLKSLYIGQPIEFTVDTYPNEVFKGVITALESSVNTLTHNILIEAKVPNTKQRLYPGMFANIRILLPQLKNVITVPQTAVSFSLYGDSIFVIKQEGKDEDGKPILIVHQHYVTTGDRQGSKIVVLKGIQVGDEVVNSGQLKLEDGIRVLVNNSVQLPELTPEELKRQF